MPRKYVHVFSYKIYLLLCPSNSSPITIFVVITKRWPNHCFVSWQAEYWCDSICQESNRRYLIWGWCGFNQRDYEFHNFLSQTFSAAKLFSCPAFLKVLWPTEFNFTYLCTMPQRGPVGEIQCSTDEVKEIKAPLPSNLLFNHFDSSRWVRINEVIDITLVSDSSHLSKTLQNDEIYVLITMYPSINCSALFFGVNERIYEHAPPTTNFLDTAVITENDTCSIQSRLVWAHWYVINFLDIQAEWKVVVLVIYYWGKTCWVKMSFFFSSFASNFLLFAFVSL